MMDADRQALVAVNVTAFLHTIARCEGTDTPEGYRALFGYHPKTNPKALFAAPPWVHPNIKVPFRQTDGEMNATTAAGKYQMLYRTATRVRDKLKLKAPDWFSPTYQDIMAMELISECRAMPAVKDGNIVVALEKCAPVWASLPASIYKQPKRNLDFAMAAYIDSGGRLA
jgi:muramidase (phage lysozyme)